MQEPSRKRTSILVAVLARVCVYGAAVLAVALCVVDFRSLLSYQPAVPRVTTKQKGTEEVGGIKPSIIDNVSRQPPPSPSESSWPNLRGPNYDAHSDETDLAESWPAEGPPLLWVRAIGRGYSGMIAVGNRVFAQAQTLTEQKILALDADTGLTVWEYAYAWPYEPGGMYPGPRATPTWSAGRIFFASPDGVVECLDAANGRRLWSVDVNQKFEGRGADFGYSCSPLVEDGKVILPVGGPKAAVVALDAETGETAWTSGGAPASYCSAIPITFRGRRQVVAFLQNQLAGFDFATGRLLWQQSYSHGYDEHSAYPLYREPYLRTMQPFRGGSDLYVLEAAPSSRTASEDFGCQLKLVRHDDKMSNDVASSVLVGDYLFGFDLRDVQTSPRRPSRGEFRCMDFKTGKIFWSSDRVGQATIVAADKKLYLFNDRGEAILIRADPQGYQELARTEVFPGEICWTAPCLHHGRLYLRSPTRAACLYVGNPERLDLGIRRTAVPTSSIAQAKWSDLSWLVGGEREYPFQLPDMHELAYWYGYSMAALIAAALASAGVYGVAWRISRLRELPSPFGRGAGDEGRKGNCSGKWQPFLSYLSVPLLRRSSAESDTLSDTACKQAVAHGGERCRLARRFGLAAFWAATLAFGIVATPLGNRFSEEFVFTWPVALFSIQQLALAAILRLRQPDQSNAAAWLGALGSLAMILACLAYYELTRQLSLVPAWYFLFAFLPSWPLAIPAAARLVKNPTSIDRWGRHSCLPKTGKNACPTDRKLLGDILWTLLAFSFYFWIAGGIILVRGALRQ